MTVPFGDLRRELDEVGPVVRSAIEDVVASGWFVLGERVKAFEGGFGAYLGADAHVTGVGSGTEALHLALLASGVGCGDYVVTVPNTAVPTVSAISETGATPLFVDVDDESLTMAPEALRALLELERPRLGTRLKAVVPVHLYGRCADMRPIVEIAHEHGLTVIEDAAQAHGARYRGSHAGTLGDLAAFSFYPSKNLGCYGDGGAVVTRDDDTAHRLAMLRNYGQSERYIHEIKGVNSRLDEMQAAILSAKLPHLDRWNARREQIAAAYGRLITAPDVRLPADAELGGRVWHLYAVRHPRRDELARSLAARGVTTLSHYPVPVHLQPAYRDLGLGPGSFPIAEAAAASVLSLPLFPQLTDAEVAAVADAVNACA